MEKEEVQSTDCFISEVLGYSEFGGKYKRKTNLNKEGGGGGKLNFLPDGCCSSALRDESRPIRYGGSIWSSQAAASRN